MLEQVDPVQYSIRLLVPPGSALTDDLARDGLLGPLAAPSYTYRWSHPDPRMDELQHEVAALVERAERDERDPVATFFEGKARAYAAAGRTPAVAAYATGAVSPRLTESWFC